MHGNNHLHRELARELPPEVGLADMAQAVRRIERLEARTGISVRRVMVPPHGACSHQFVDHLARLGLEAICMSSTDLVDVRSPSVRSCLPADVVAGIPILSRYHLQNSRDDLVFRALLGQPLVVYGHHEDASEGLDVFTEAARDVSSLGDVKWCDLATIARSNFVTRETDDRLDVRLFSNDAYVTTHASSVAVGGADEACDVRFLFEGDGAASTPGGERRLRVVVTRRDSVVATAVGAPPRRLWAKPRRALTEARDRLMPASRSLKTGHVRFGRGGT
jgi:hypothetical protein